MSEKDWLLNILVNANEFLKKEDEKTSIDEKLRQYKIREVGSRDAKVYVKVRGVFYEIEILSYLLTGELKNNALVNIYNENIKGIILNTKNLYIIEPNEFCNFKMLANISDIKFFNKFKHWDYILNNLDKE